jgi:PEP-CTERM motif
MNSIVKVPLRLIAILLASAATCLATPTIWSGPLINFSKANFANPTLAVNQDRITPDLWLTRGSSQGLYDAHDEAGFTHFASPSGTQWATGSLANYASLSYTDWNSWAKGVNAGPTSTIGIQAVVHIIPDDIYFSIKFTSWTSGGAGGGFSYIRSTAVPEPGTGSLVLVGLGVIGAAKLRKRRNV